MIFEHIFLYGGELKEDVDFLYKKGVTMIFLKYLLYRGQSERKHRFSIKDNGFAWLCYNIEF